MTSIVVLMISIFIIIAITGETADVQTDKDMIGWHSYGLKSNVSGNDVSTSTETTKYKKLLRRPLDIKQLRRRRSKSNVTSTSKIGVTVLAGVNPFAMILANRVYSNTTGSIKPLGLWNQIVGLFKN